jgi:hypothetical protein
MRYLTYKQSGHNVHDSVFFKTMDLYDETGLFIFLADAFLICQNKGYNLPDDLLLKITKHFDEFVNAEERMDGLAALGFRSNEKGGAWQGKAARAKANQAEILGLVKDFEVLTSNKKKDIFNAVATACDTSFGHVKNLDHENNKK